MPGPALQPGARLTGVEKEGGRNFLPSKEGGEGKGGAGRKEETSLRLPASRAMQLLSIFKL